MAAVLSLANRATREELEAAGITGQRIEDLIGGRPYASVQKLGYTRGVGPDTMRKLHAAATGPR
jgi:DNA uptake protein ComE-like DNA-binding protein